MTEGTCPHGVPKAAHCLRCDRDDDLITAGYPPPTILKPDDVLGSGDAAANPDRPICAARRQGTAGGNYPADCDWPNCGCAKASP